MSLVKNDSVSARHFFTIAVPKVPEPPVMTNLLKNTPNCVELSILNSTL